MCGYQALALGCGWCYSGLCALHEADEQLAVLTVHRMVHGCMERIIVPEAVDYQAFNEKAESTSPTITPIGRMLCRPKTHFRHCDETVKEFRPSNRLQKYG